MTRRPLSETDPMSTRFAARGLPLKRLTRAALGLALAGLVGAVGCSGDDPAGEPEEEPLPTGEVGVNVTYPNESARSVTAVLHAWVLAEREDAGADDDRARFTCASLVGGALDPYDLALTRRADVASTEDVSAVTAQHVAPGSALVYVEASGFDGSAEFAGCAETDVGDALVEASISLSKAKIFDCSDPDTEDGSPCDDGQLCTVGETCEAGSCQGGVPRTCSFATDNCQAGSCDETLGCVVQPLADGTPCDDGLFCTEVDTCTAGECSGSARDCSEEAGACEIALGCDESLDRCVMSNASSGTTCDDGLFCTEFDQCDGFGSCVGSTRDCTTGVPQCEVSTGCDETLDACTTANATAGTVCDDGLFCTDVDQCDGLGACTGSARDCSAFDGVCVVGACNELLGNCESQPSTAGTSCNDGVTCTADTCNGGGSCTTSATPRPISTPCDDGNLATSGDVCDGAGTCAGI